MDRVELLEAASRKLAEAVLLLVKAAEQHLATSAGELAEIVELPGTALGLISRCYSDTRDITFLRHGTKTPG